VNSRPVNNRFTGIDLAKADGRAQQVLIGEEAMGAQLADERVGAQDVVFALLNDV
jgi:hypothetical protein